MQMTHLDEFNSPWHLTEQEEKKEARPYLALIQEHKDSDVGKEKNHKHKQRQQ